MKKKFILVFLICTGTWGVAQQQNLMPFRSKLDNKTNVTKIDNKQINFTAISEKKIIPYENRQSIKLTFVEDDHTIIQTNSGISDNSSTHFTLNRRESIPISREEHYLDDAQMKLLSSPDAVWNTRKFIITTKAKNHHAVNPDQDNTNESKQQKQSDDKSDTPIDPNKIRCPIVGKIQQTAQKINEAFLSQDTYIIISHDPVFQDNNLDWLVGAIGIVAGSSDEAIYMAGIATSQTNLRKNEYAEKVDDKSFSSDGLYDFFVCHYSPGDIIAVGVRDKMFVDK